MFEDSHKKQDVRIPLELMMDRTGLSFHTNLLDCHVDICSPELMVQFSDNFDYQVRLLRSLYAVDPCTMYGCQYT